MSRLSGLQRCWAVVSRCFSVLVVFASIDAGHRALGQDSAPTEVNETFDGGDFDRMRWTLNNISVAAHQGRFLEEDDAARYPARAG